MLRITNDGGDFEVEVLELSDIRGPSVAAQALYRETEASRELRQKVAAERKAAMQFEQRYLRAVPRSATAVILFSSGASG